MGVLLQARDEREEPSLGDKRRGYSDQVSQCSLGKKMAAVFFRRCGILQPVLSKQGAKVEAQWHSIVCLQQVLQQIAQQRPNIQEKGIRLHHDNAPVHRAKAEQNFLQTTQLELLPHSAYSPNLAPADSEGEEESKGKALQLNRGANAAPQMELERFTPDDLRGCFNCMVPVNVKVLGSFRKLC